MRQYLSIPFVVRIGLLCTLGFLLLLAVSPVRADSIARFGSDWVRLTLKPCQDAAVVAVIEQRGMDPASHRAGTSHVGGQDYNVCWQPANGGALLVYADGDAGLVPTSALKPAPEA